VSTDETGATPAVACVAVAAGGTGAMPAGGTVVGEVTTAADCGSIVGTACGLAAGVMPCTCACCGFVGSTNRFVLTTAGIKSPRDVVG
jgi:hypothetical protein